MESQGLAGGIKGALDVPMERGGKGYAGGFGWQRDCQRGLYGGKELGCGLRGLGERCDEIGLFGGMLVLLCCVACMRDGLGVFF